MKMYGIRIYQMDFLRIFSPLAASWRGHIFATFGVTLNGEGKVEDPAPALRHQYGSALIAFDVKTQFALLRGDDFGRWGKTMSFCEGALLPIFREAPSFELSRKAEPSQGA